MADTAVVKYETDSADITEIEKTLVVSNQQEYDVAATYEAAALDLEKKVKAHHKPIKQATDKAHKVAVAAENALLKPILKVRKLIRGKMTAYYVEEERKRKAEADKLAKEAEDKRLAEAEKLADEGKEEQAEELLSAPAPVAQPAAIAKPNGIHYRDNWKARVVAEKDVPITWMIPDVRRLDIHAKQYKDKAQVAGVEFYNDRYQVG